MPYGRLPDVLLLLRRETFHRFNRFVLLGIILSSLILPMIKLHVNPAGLNSPVQKLETTFAGDTLMPSPCRNQDRSGQAEGAQNTRLSGADLPCGAIIQ